MPASKEWQRVKKARAYRRVGALLQRARRCAGYTQEQAAERSGLSTSFVSQCENGYYCISIPALLKLACAYGTAVSEILEGL